MIRVVLVCVLLAVALKAEDGCPWLNAASAAGVLGGSVQLRRSGSTCTFTTHQSELRIQVDPVRVSHRERCHGSLEQIKGIGNEASVCDVETNDGRISEQVAGRVREQAFVILVLTTDRSARRDSLREKARDAAEQVAGTLF